MKTTKESHSRLAQIARRDFIKKNDLDDDDEDNNDDNDEGYNIDPSSNMWKPIEFGKYNSKKEIAASFKSSISDSKLPNLPNINNNSNNSNNNINTIDKGNQKKYDNKDLQVKKELKQNERFIDIATPTISLPMVAISKTIPPPVINNNHSNYSSSSSSTTTTTSSQFLPLQSIPIPSTVPKKKSSPRMSKKEYDEVNSLIFDLKNESHEKEEFDKLHENEINELLKEKAKMKEMVELFEKEKNEMLKLTKEKEQQYNEMALKANAAQENIEKLRKEKEEINNLLVIQQNETNETKKQLTIHYNMNMELQNNEKAERERLLKELFEMRNQNEGLMKQIEIVRIDNEKITEIENSNKEYTNKLLQQQKIFEDNLLEEKNELKRILKKNENEKILLLKKIYEIEVNSKSEIQNLINEKSEHEKNLDKLKKEKNEILKLVIQNKNELENKNETETKKLNSNIENLQNNLNEIEKEKNRLEANLSSKENLIQTLIHDLKVKLENEKEILNKNTQKMEEEKNAIISSLQKSEREAKEHSLILMKQLENEQHEMEATKKQIEHEKNNIIQIIKQNRLNEGNDEKIALENQNLELILKNLINEKNDIESKLKEKLENEKELEKERLLNEKLANERDELKQLVQRMKEEMELEKKRIEEEKLLFYSSNNNNNGNNGNNSNSNSPHPHSLTPDSHSKSKRNLVPSTSLYNMMESDEQYTPTSQKETRNNRSHAILPIVEIDELKTQHLSHDMDDSPPTEVRNTLEFNENTNDQNNLHFSDQNRYEYQEGELSRNEYNNGENYEYHEIQYYNEDEVIHPVDSEQEHELGQDFNQVEEEFDDEFVDLPVPHAAAARNNFKKLKSLAQLDDSLLSSFDSAGRTPLFYAVAYDHSIIANYLMEVSPECIFQTDCHGDAPLHAAAASGSAACVDLIIRAMADKGVDGVDIRNNMGMTPTHLASNSQVLDILNSAGADMAAIDNNNRTALFVAAAMNRQDCVQYLLDCLDGNEDALYMADSRGDTPLHAAACNGAEESLLLLLQCGISPLILNHKGLKAIDLAQKNKKKKCREILAQYHLHFATTSDFDSVLFIAALEGQKKVQDAMMSAIKSPESNEGYNIIKICHMENVQGDEMKERAKQLFSLHTKKSLRLQRLGSWIAYEDQNTGSTYYYNHKTGEGQWNMPTSVSTLMKKSSSLSSKSSKSVLQISAKASMRLKKVGDWIQYSTESGRTFYYNDKNGDFQWVNPEKQNIQDNEMMNKAKEEEWVPYKDPESGCIFWYNKRTNVSQWECPILPQTQQNNEQQEWNTYEEGVVEVHNDADLGID